MDIGRMFSSKRRRDMGISFLSRVRLVNGKISVIRVTLAAGRSLLFYLANANAKGPAASRAFLY